MTDSADWNWDVGSRTLADLGALRAEHDDVHELVVSNDGERVAAPVVKEDGSYRVAVNDTLWEPELEKAWHLKFTPDDRLTALVRVDDMWTVAVEGQLWENQYPFAWNTKFSADGSVIAVQIKAGMEYSLCLDDKPWDKNFLSVRNYALSDDGSRAAALVQVEELAEADTEKFAEGTWSVAVDGETWDDKFIGVWAPVVSPDGKHVAVQTRTGRFEYTIAADGAPWESRYSCVWDPVFRPRGLAQGLGLLAPVRTGTTWRLAEDGEPLWKTPYVQLWYVRFSPAGERVAAVVATDWGQFTVAVDNRPWKRTFGDVVMAPVFAPGGKRVAATVKHEGRWSVAVDGEAWTQSFDMVYNPVLGPGRGPVLAKVEQKGVFGVAVNGRLTADRYEQLWDPIYSSDGEKVLLRGVQDGKYTRRVVLTKDLR